MRKIVQTLTLALILFAATFISTAILFSEAESAENTWVTKASMKEARANSGIAAVNGKIYVFGGDQGSPMGNAVPEDVITANTVGFTEEYDPASDTWSFKKPMPTARALFGVAVYKNKVYCIGGYYGVNGPDDTQYFNVGVNEVYDPAADTWETRTPLPTFGSSATASVVDGKIYVLNSESLQVYDPETDSWATRKPPPHWIASFTSATIDDKIYTLAEMDESNYVWPFTINIIVYDSKNDYWMVGSESPFHSHFQKVPMSATTGFNATKLVYFFDEYGTQAYNPRNDSWTVAEPMPSPRLLVGITTVDDVFYVIGGRSGQHGYITMLEPSTVNEQYTPFHYGAPDLSPVELSLHPIGVTDKTPPTISILSPANITNTANASGILEVPLIFEADENLSWAGYSLDGGSNINVVNGTLIEIEVGSRNLTLYANDTFGNTGISETINFTVVAPKPEPERFPFVPVAVASTFSIAAVAAAGIILFTRRKRCKEATPK